jgi:hypothetical protein
MNCYAHCAEKLSYEEGSPLTPNPSPPRGEGSKTRTTLVPVGFTLIHASSAQKRFFCEGCGENLQSDWQPSLGEGTRDADAGDPGEVATDEVSPSIYDPCKIKIISLMKRHWDSISRTVMLFRLMG